MPLHVFSMTDGRGPTDRVNRQIDGPGQARPAAVVTAGGMLRDAAGPFWHAPTRRLHVTSEEGPPRACSPSHAARGRGGIEAQPRPGAGPSARLNVGNAVASGLGIQRGLVNEGMKLQSTIHVAPGSR